MENFIIFFFKLIFYWPFRILFWIVREIIELIQDIKSRQYQRESEARSADYAAKQEQERRNRSTLYGGSPQSDK
ncbi:MAG: hypothetical protein WA441_06110 [Methyloceanibacter sp.]